MIIDNIAITNSGERFELSEGEMKIVKALRQLEKLWELHGKRLLLFNGRDLRIIKKSDGSYYNEQEIESYSIKGDGGDGGD